MKIQDIQLREIFDSRGEPTLEVLLIDQHKRTFAAQLPSGKSRGEREVCVLSPAQATESLVDLVHPALVGTEHSQCSSVDAILLSLDATPDKRKIGGNLALGVSIAAVRSLATERSVEPWQLIRDEYFAKANAAQFPRIYANFINGGQHARNNLAIQEYLVIIETSLSMRDAIRQLITLYHDIGDSLREHLNSANLPIGDEGGYSVDFPDNGDPLRMIQNRIVGLGLGDRCKLGIDAAANSFFRNGAYEFGGKRISTDELAAVYAEYARELTLLTSIEDPFAENDEDGFRKLALAMPHLTLIGDDLTTTNANSIAGAIDRGAIGGAIIKPNQIGTVTETCAAISATRDRDGTVIISHRSGETEDPFIIHLARACAADGVKIGAPARERIVKYNELIRLYS